MCLFFLYLGICLCKVSNWTGENMLFFEDISADQLPKEIKSKNLLSVIIEIRLKKPLALEQNIFLLYPKIQEHFEFPVKMNMPVPPEVKAYDVNFKYLPDWTLNDKSKLYTLGIGTYSIALTSLNFRYKGWDSFFEEWQKLWTICSNIFSVSENIEQVGVRFINAFNHLENFYNNLNLTAKINDTDLLDFDYTPNLTIQYKNKLIKLAISNNASYGYYDFVTNEQKIYNKASIIDIDIITNQNIQSDSVIQTINDNHKIAKQIFFSIWRKDKIKNVLGEAL